MDNQAQITLNFDQNPLDINKHIRDLDYTQALKEQSYIFNDGDDQHVDLFLFKIGVNGNGFGVGKETAEQRANEFIGNDIIVDPFGITHKNGMRTKEFIEQNQGKLSVGKVTKIKKYDRDHDGYFDFFRGIGLIDKCPEKQKLFAAALEAGVNETSPTILPLNLNEDVTNMLTWKPMNVAIVKNGAYFQDSKIVALCKGSKQSCHNALAASLQNNGNTHTPLIDLLTKTGYMGNNDGSSNDPNSGVQSGSNNPSNPLVSIFTSNNPSATNPPIGKSLEQERPEDKKPEEKPQQPEETEEVKNLRKQNAQLLEDKRISMLNEMAPLDLFEGKEDERQKFLKEHKDVKLVEEIYNFNKDYVPRFLKYYLAQQQTSTKPEDSEKKDDKKNPLAAGLTTGFPKFDNDTISNPQDQEKAMIQALSKRSLRSLDQFAKKMNNDDVVGVI